MPPVEVRDPGVQYKRVFDLGGGCFDDTISVDEESSGMV